MYFLQVNIDAWNAMEARAREIMAKKWEAEKAIKNKLKLIHEYNLAHPILKTEEIQPNQQEEPQVILNSADYVLRYLFPTAKRKAKE